MSNKEIYCSLQYGYANVKSNQYNEDEAGKSYDICDELGSNIINYNQDILMMDNFIQYVYLVYPLFLFNSLLFDFLFLKKISLSSSFSVIYSRILYFC